MIVTRVKTVTPENEDGYRLWLRYPRIDDRTRQRQYRRVIESVSILAEGPTYDIVKHELDLALPVMLDRPVSIGRDRAAVAASGNAVVVGTLENLERAGIKMPPADCLKIGDEGFLVRRINTGGDRWTIIAASTGAGVIRGVFHFLRLLQAQQDIREIDILSCPRIRRRLLCHWDNIDGSVERGYAGRSLWKWERLPGEIESRYREYARACASIGLNGAVLNNVNSQVESLSHEYLVKTAAIADVLRPYGIRVYLSAAFDAPVRLGGLPTSDPRDPKVARWWKRKAEEIYRLIPDFGGFQVKAGSEGQPGPQDHGANHQDGANMLAEALNTGEHQGVVLWRAFVYDTRIDHDRAKCAYKEFAPLDGRFADGVFVQVKNGPIDFQPREPFHPLLGAMPKTPLALELQITQEYLGQAVHLVYLAPMWKEVLSADTYAGGAKSTVAEIIDGSRYGRTDSAITGVANTGSARNWCGHHFAQANWYAYGRLAWDHRLSSAAIGEEWIRMTWSNDPAVIDSIKVMMLGSREACVNYMTPLGLHHLMQEGHHYGPDPALDTAGRADWNSVYYHRADATGLGFDRSRTGSNATGQYFSPLREVYDKLATCPDEYLLWFHHVPWDYRLRSGRTLYDEIRYRYNAGVEYVTGMRKTWENLRRKIDRRRHEHVGKRLKQQEKNARLWRDVCTRYFRHFAEPD